MNDSQNNTQGSTEHKKGTPQRTHINQKLIQNKTKIKQAFNGDTGQPPPWRPNEERERDQDKQNTEKTNNKGVRSKEATERRQAQRTIKRRIARTQSYPTQTKTPTY